MGLSLLMTLVGLGLTVAGAAIATGGASSALRELVRQGREQPPDTDRRLAAAVERQAASARTGFFLISIGAVLQIGAIISPLLVIARP